MNKMTPLQRSMASLSIGLLALSGCSTTAPNSMSSAALLAPRGSEEVFQSPEQAAHALVEANRHNDKAALFKILGKNSDKLVRSGDPVADKEGRQKFVSAYDTAHKFEATDGGQELLIIGDEEWPLPIPLVHVADGDKAEGGWQFNTEAGQDEILNRRIGHNEIYTIGICQTYVEAQRDYAAQKRTPDRVPEYAQHFVSHAGKHDGLYWPTVAGEEESPLGPLFADARAEGYDAAHKGGKRHPYHGYYYKILKGQSENAAGGAGDYVTNGHMTGGFALIAFPAKYGDSGVMTFIVNQNGIVFQKNLGTDTATMARQITQYDPDESWSIVKVQE